MSAQFNQWQQQALRFAARIRPHHLAIAAAVAAIGLGVAGVRAVALPGPRTVLDTERLQISVVAPVEPNIAPGSVMEVGDLVDGFVYRPPPRLAPEPLAYAAYDEDYDADFYAGQSRRKPRPSDEPAVIRAPPQPEAAPGGWRDTRVSRWLGFDGPERDYRAEREARRARLDEQAERERRDRRRYASDGPVDGGPQRDYPVDRADRFDRDPRMEARPDPGQDRRERRYYTADGRPVGPPN